MGNTSSPNADNLLLGAGMLYFDRLDASGNPTGERPLGNCTTFNLTVGADVAEKFSSMEATRNLYLSVVKQTRATGKITMDEFDPYNVAMCLLGDTSVMNQSSGTVAAGAAETYTAKRGFMIKLGGSVPANQKFNITPSSIVVKNGATTYKVNRDYILINAAAGVLFIPDTAANTIVDGTTLTVTYDYNALVIRKITGGTNTRVEGYLRFVGDPTVGPRFEAELWKVVVVPEGDIAMIADDFKDLSITIECQDDTMNHPVEPFYRLLKY